MRFFSTAIFIVLLSTVLTMSAWAEERVPFFADDQLRLAESYLQSGNPTAAIAPLLNILRSGDYRGTEIDRKTRWRLAIAYVDTGLYGSAERLLKSLVGEDGHERVSALRELTQLHLQRDIEKGLETLQSYRSAVTEAVDHEVVLRAAHSAFSAGLTDSAEALFRELMDSPAKDEAAYFLGVSHVLRNEPREAAANFRHVLKQSERAENPALHDRALLALARLHFENADYTRAIEKYAAMPADSVDFDHALYEGAWSYLKLGDLRAARAALLSLALDQPLSTLQPRARLLFGYVLLESENFTAAQQRFSGYIAHYGAVNDRISELEAHEDRAAVYHMLLDNMTDTLTDGSRQDLELLSWLQSRDAVKRAHRTVTALRGVESEVSDTVRTLRDVQRLSEESYGDSEELRNMLHRLTELELSERKLRDYLGSEVRRYGQRLSGDAGETFQPILQQLNTIHSAQADIKRLEDQNQEKRQELINLLQYAEASRFHQWLENEGTDANQNTPSGAGRIEVLFEQIDESDLALHETWRRMIRMEMEVWEAAMQTLRIRYPDDRIANLLQAAERLRRLSMESSGLKIALERRRRQTASSARPAIANYLEQLQTLRKSLRALLAQAETARGSLTLEEALDVREEIGLMLADAKLGSIDVAWKGRERALFIGREAASRQTKELDALEQMYAAFEQALHTSESRGEVSGEPGESRSQNLGGRVAQVSSVLERHIEVFQQQLENSSGLESQLRQDLERDRESASVHTAALSFNVPHSLPERGLELVGQEFYVNGRKIETTDEPPSLGFMQPGGHQIDVLLTYHDGRGNEHNLRGTFYGLMDSGKRYRLAIVPEGDTKPQLQFALRRGGGNP